MDKSSASIRAWTERLLAAEAADPFASDAQVPEAMRVSEKLRISLTRFVGADGFTALLRRALALARAEVPSLQNVKVTAEGRLEGINTLASEGGTEVEAAAAITEHLLALLVNFIGEPLTFRLIRSAWPDASLESFLN